MLMTRGRRCENGKPVPVDRSRLAAIRAGAGRGRPRRLQGVAEPEVGGRERGHQPDLRRVRELPPGLSRRRHRGHALHPAIASNACADVARNLNTFKYILTTAARARSL